MSFLFWKYRIYFLFMNYSTLLSRKLSEKLGCQSSGTSEELLSCFQQVSKLNHNIFCYFKFYFKFTLYHALANVFFFAHFCGTSICTSVFFWILRHLLCSRSTSMKSSNSKECLKSSIFLSSSSQWLMTSPVILLFQRILGTVLKLENSTRFQSSLEETMMKHFSMLFGTILMKLCLKNCPQNGRQNLGLSSFFIGKKSKKKLTFELISL